MTRGYEKTLGLVFDKRTPSTLEWRNVEALFVALGAATVQPPRLPCRTRSHLLAGAEPTLHVYRHAVGLEASIE